MIYCEFHLSEILTQAIPKLSGSINICTMTKKGKMESLSLGSFR